MFSHCEREASTRRATGHVYRHGSAHGLKSLTMNYAIRMTPIAQILHTRQHTHCILTSTRILAGVTCLQMRESKPRVGDEFCIYARLMQDVIRLHSCTGHPSASYQNTTSKNSLEPITTVCKKLSVRGLNSACLPPPAYRTPSNHRPPHFPVAGFQTSPSPHLCIETAPRSISAT